MRLNSQKHFIIKTKLSREEIYNRVLFNKDVKTFEMDIYFSTNAAQKFAEQKLRESLSIDNTPRINTMSFHHFKGKIIQHNNYNEMNIDVKGGLPKILFFIIWGGLCGAGCLISILAFLFIPMKDIEPSQIPLFFIPFFLLVLGYIAIRFTIRKDVQMAKRYFTLLFEGF